MEAWLEAVGGIARSVTSSSTLCDILDLIAETSCRLMGYDFCAVLLSDGGRDRLVIEGSHGLSAEYVGRVNEERPIQLGPGPLGEGPSSRAFLSGVPVAVNDVSADSSFGPWAGVAFDQGYRSMLSMPMVIAGRSPVGTLNCYTAASRDFPPAEVSLLAAMANQAAIAIEGTRLRVQERAQIKELRRLNRSLEAQRSTLRQAEQIHRELTDVALAEEGLPAVAGALARLLEAHVTIEDAEGQELGAAAAGRPPAAPPSVIRGLPEVIGALAGIETARRVLELAVELPGPEGGLGQRARIAVAPVTLDGHPAARVWALDLGSVLGPIGRRIMEHGAIVVAHELLKLRAAQEAEWRLREDLLNDLLEEAHSQSRRRAPPAEQEAVQARAAQLGHDLSLPHTVLLVRFDEETEGPAGAQGERVAPARRHPGNLADLVRRLAAGSEPRPLVSVRGEAVVVLIPTVADPPWGSAKALAHSIRREAARAMYATVSVVVGGENAKRSRYPVAYRQARGALELVAAQEARDTVVFVEDLGAYALLLLIDEPEILAQFAEGLLRPIEEHTKRHRSELEETLRAYLDHGLRMQETASALYVHVNTLSQRLRRIEELIGADLRAPRTLLELQLALMIKNLAAARSPT